MKHHFAVHPSHPFFAYSSLIPSAAIFLQHSTTSPPNCRSIMEKDEYGNIHSEMSIIDFVHEMDKPYDPQIEKDPITFSSQLDGIRPMTEDEQQEALEKAAAPVPARFDIFKRLLEMEEKNHTGQKDIRAMMDEVRKVQSAISGQQSMNSNHINEIRIQQMAIIQQNEQSAQVLLDSQGTNRTSHQLRADCEDIKKSVEAKVTQLAELEAQLKSKFEDVDQKQAGLEAVGNEIQSKVEWTTTQNGQIAQSTAELGELSRSIMSRQEELTAQEKRNIERQEYLTSQEKSLSKMLAEARNTLADLNSFKSMVSEQYNELVVLQRKMQEENLKRESDKQRQLAEIAGEREILYDEVREMKQTLADMMSNVKQR